MLEIGVDLINEGVRNVNITPQKGGQHPQQHLLSHGQTTMFNLLLNTFRVLIFLILIIYLSKYCRNLKHIAVIVINYCFKKSPRQLRPKRGSP